MDVSFSAVQVLENGYKGREVEVNWCSPRMTTHFTSEEWNACVDYAHRAERYCHQGRTPPNGPPPRWFEYIRMVEDGFQVQTSNPYYQDNRFHHDAPPTEPGPPIAPTFGPAPTSPGIVSMPPEALGTLFNAQYRMFELMVGGNRGRTELNHFGRRPFQGPHHKPAYHPPKPKHKKNKSKQKKSAPPAIHHR